MSQMDGALAKIILRDGRGHYIHCTKCNRETDIYNPKKIQVFVCPNCRMAYAPYGATQQLSNKKKKNSSKLEDDGKLEDDFIVPLHIRCRFDREYTVVGRARKHESHDRNALWEEYTLIDDSGTYAFLSVSYGHWILLHPCDPPANFDTRQEQKEFTGNDGLLYKFYSSYYQRTIIADGEFPYNVIDTGKRLSQEYIHPPHIFTFEVWAGEKTFFQGRYIRPAQIAKAFAPTLFPMPFKEGVGSCQPFYLGINYKQFNKLSLIFFLLTLPVYGVFLASHTSRGLVNFGVRMPDSVRTTEVVSRSFEINGLLPSGIEVECNSNVIQDWVEGQLVLVNEQTGEERSCVVGIEYYSGTTDGESWIESSNSSPVYFDQLESGKYHFEMTVFASDKPYRYTDVTFSMNAASYTATSWNYWLLIGSFLVINIIVLISGDRFEKLRFGLIDTDTEEDDE
jgi:hypothetical protein